MKWQDYAPEYTTRVREDIEWSISYTFNANEKKNANKNGLKSPMLASDKIKLTKATVKYFKTNS